ncbi:unnamed protein product [Bursaphelenchus xylophilus]|uniref:(pine wood nematode) hypothetical protein n=1 Tax=Bursaphelenchus xylophilus TaxID=6326 RepID=A0A811K4P9_BURXY|nr:unnamed protein product [Bursaphelenchus xylophilus]CAG9086290.1 unnamed protein product [Bursaphelenchus xylophilus]
MIGNFDEEGRTDAAKCLIFPTRPTADTIPELVLTFQAQLMFDINIDEAGSSKDRDIHDLLNGKAGSQLGLQDKMKLFAAQLGEADLRSKFKASSAEGILHIERNEGWSTSKPVFSGFPDLIREFFSAARASHARTNENTLKTVP